MRIKIDGRIRRIWLIFLMVFPHIKPSSISTLYPMASQLYTAGSIASFLLIVLMILKRRVKAQSVLILIVLMELWVTYTTALHGSESLFDNLLALMSSVAIPLIIYHFSDRMDELLSALMMNYEWLIYASLLSVMLYYPDGMYISGNARQYFLGNENGIIFYAIPAMFLAFIHMKKERRYLRGALLILACLANEIIVWCATAIVGIAIGALVIVLSIRRKRRVNYFIILAGTLLADVLVTVVRVFDRYWLSMYVIQDLLGKSVTLSRRTYIWDNAVAMIPSALGTGLGRGDHVPFRDSYFHAHNQYFQVLLIGGVPLLILFFILLFFLGKRINKNQRATYGNLMVLAMLTCLFVQFIATSRLTFRLYVPLMLASYANEINRAIDARAMTRPRRRRWTARE